MRDLELPRVGEGMEHERQETPVGETERSGVSGTAARVPKRVTPEARRAAGRVGDDIAVGLACPDPGSARHTWFLVPSMNETVGAPLHVRRGQSILGGVLQRRGPLVVNELGNPRFEEERAMAADGFRSYVALRNDTAQRGPAAAVFASRSPRRFDAVTVGALVGYLEEPGARPSSADALGDVAQSVSGGRDTVVGESEAFLEICRLIAIVARKNTTVLIQGESGTGKEVLAKTIHRYSDRAERPFVRVNCAALAESLVESEMFGHRKGAFTGAIATHKGRFEMADGGTLLLDEIGNLSLTGQAKLLRVLQESEFEPVGQSSSVKVDVRIIATTNVDLEREIRSGGFREDLYYRLAVVPIRVPPLRDRRKDVRPLAEHFLGRAVVDLGKPALELAPETMERLMAYDWPGNARELRNAMEYAALVARGGRILPENLPSQIDGGNGEPHDRDDGTLRERMQRFERRVVLEAFERAGGVRKDVAKILGIDPRNVSYFLRKHNIR